MQSRLNKLAFLRAEYENHVSAAENSRLVLDQARKQLGEMKATHAAAKAASLVSVIDIPETGPNPVGLGRSQVVLLGSVGGCFLAVAWIFLTSASFNSPRVVGESHLAAARPSATHSHQNADPYQGTREDWNPANSSTQDSVSSVPEKNAHTVAAVPPIHTQDVGMNLLRSSGNGAMQAN